MAKSNKKNKINIREIIWPLLEPLEEKAIKQISYKDCNFKKDEIDFLLEYIEKYSKDEEDRRKDIESKSTIFIGTFSVIITILTSLVKNNTDKLNNSFELVPTLIMILSIIYLCRAVWFSIKVLQRRKYFKFGFPKFMLDDIENKKEKIIIDKYNNVKRNQEEINIMVDYMTMAQEYFKRAIVVVAVFSVILLLDVIINRYNYEIAFIFKFLINNKRLTYYVIENILLLIMFKTIPYWINKEES